MTSRITDRSMYLLSTYLKLGKLKYHAKFLFLINTQYYGLPLSGQSMMLNFR